MEQKKRKQIKVWIIRVVLLILIGFWMYTIWGFSADDGVESQSLSDKITLEVVQIIEPQFDRLTILEQEALLEKTSFYVRKTGHCGEFALLSVLVGCFLLTIGSIRNLRKLYFVVITTAYGICYGAIDEIHQLFVDGRDGRVMDVAIDSFGALLGTIFVLIIWKLVEKRGRKNVGK